jgi:ornithine cyclodeaminase/alanine dehydrogenase-like protein (mu-crystallin family)
MREAGDILLAIEDGLIGPDHVSAELGEVAAGARPGRQHDAQVTLFKSLGLAIEDVVSAGLAYRRARAAGCGILVPL